MKHISACTLDCPDCCSIIIEQDEEGNITAKGNPDHPFTKGFFCPKGRRAIDRLNSEDRITTPLLKRNGEFTPISWDAALRLIAGQIDAHRNTPESILHIQSHGFRGVLAKAGKFFFSSLKASGTHGALCDDAGIAACIEDFGALDINDTDDLASAKIIVNWGTDLSRKSPHLSATLKQSVKNGTRIITISPGGDGNAPYSEKCIRIRPGTDRYLAAAITQKLLTRGYADPAAFNACSNWKAYKELIAVQNIDRLLAVCECSEQDLNFLVNIYANENMDPVATLIGWGLQRYVFGAENVRFINALALLSGNIGIRLGGSYFGQSSSRYLPTPWVDGGTYSRTFLMPKIGQEILNANPPVKMLFVQGSNFVNQTPDAQSNIKAMETIPFKVVIDAFMTDTAMRADLILPAALPHEREDLLGSFWHNYVQYTAQAFPPAGQARNDFDILRELGSRLTQPIVMPDPEECLKQAIAHDRLNTSLEELREKGWAKAIHSGIAFPNHEFAHPDGKYRLPEALHAEPPKPDGYPLHLLTLINKDYLHSQIPEEEQKKPLTCEVSLSNPILGSIDKTKPVYLATPAGRIAIELKAAEGLHARTVIVRRGGWMKHNQSLNHIIAPYVTDMGDNAAYYSQYCRIEQDD